LIQPSRQRMLMTGHGFRMKTTDLLVEESSYAPRFHGEWHRHEHAQLIYPSRGTMTIHMKERSWVVPPFRACWLAPDEPHCVESSGRLEMQSVYCQGAILQRLPKETGIVQVSGLLREIILRIPETQRMDDNDRIGRLSALLADEITLQQSTSLVCPPALSNRLSRISEALAKDPSDSRTLTEWARELGVSARTLARAFQREMRLTFPTYRQQVRLRAAIQRLAMGATVSTVAYDLGFSSASNFIVAFRNAVGTTPRRYFSGKS
jgi:AraC-like DNA-binding protein